jgi:hypothetical protein
VQTLSQANALAARLADQLCNNLRRDGLDPVFVDLSSNDLARFDVYGSEEEQDSELTYATFLVVRSNNRNGDEWYAVQERDPESGDLTCHVAPGVWFNLDAGNDR